MKLLIDGLELPINLRIIPLFLQLFEDLVKSKLNFPFMFMFEICPADTEAGDLNHNDKDGNNGHPNDQTDIKITQFCIRVQNIARVARRARFYKYTSVIVDSGGASIAPADFAEASCQGDQHQNQQQLLYHLAFNIYYYDHMLFKLNFLQYVI